MENIKRKCNLLDDRLASMVDSDDDKKRVEVMFKTLLLEINEKLLYCKRNYPEYNDRILVLGKTEIDVLSAYIKQHLLEMYDVDDDLNLPVITEYEFTDENGVLKNIWNMPIYISQEETYLDIAVAPEESIFDEDFEVKVRTDIKRDKNGKIIC